MHRALTGANRIQAFLTAAAINLKRLATALGEPLARSRMVVACAA